MASLSAALLSTHVDAMKVAAAASASNVVRVVQSSSDDAAVVVSLDNKVETSSSSSSSDEYSCHRTTGNSSPSPMTLSAREVCFPLDLDLVQALGNHHHYPPCTMDTTVTVPTNNTEEQLFFSVQDLQEISRDARAHLMELTVSRTGREQQRWGYVGVGGEDDDDHTTTTTTSTTNQRVTVVPNCRLTTGCIPILPGGRILLISSTKSQDVFVLPKGGWEQDESLPLSALRETLEEAGVTGLLGPPLPEMTYETKKAAKLRMAQARAEAPITTTTAPTTNNNNSTTSEEPGAAHHTHNRLIIFPMYVQSIYEQWPEQNRLRRAVTIDEAAVLLQHRPEFLQSLQALRERNLHRLLLPDS